MASSPDYSILHAPRITATKFASILRAGHSPAYPEAAACYAAATSRGVDPAVLLAIFRKESTYGRFGRARTNRSWGNLRRSPDYPTVNAFVKYPSWAAGAGDAARLLAIYGRNQIRKGKNTSTVQTMPYVWAPASDGNGPDRYGDQLAKWIHEWTGQPGDVAGAVAAVTASSSSSGIGKGTTTAATSTEPVTIPFRPVFITTFRRATTGRLDSWYAAQWAGYILEQRGTGGDSSGLLPFLNPSASDYQQQLATTRSALEATAKGYVGKTYGELPDSVTVTVGSKFEADPTVLVANALATLGTTVAAGIAEGLKNTVVLLGIVAIIVLALYRLVR